MVLAETDLRDHNGQIIISHDIASDNILYLDNLFSLFSDLKLTLALLILNQTVYKIY